MPLVAAVAGNAPMEWKKEEWTPLNEASPWAPMSGLYQAPFEPRVVLGRHVKIGREVSILAICRYSYTGEDEDPSGFPCDPLTPREALTLAFVCLRAGLRAIAGRSVSRLRVQ